MTFHLSLSQEKLNRLVRAVSKQELADWMRIKPGSVSKDALVEKVVERIQSNELDWRRFFTKFSKDTTLSPPDVEEILGCSKTERRRWTDEGLLPVSHRIDVRKYGRTLAVPQYSVIDIIKVAPKMERWREKHAKAVTKSRKKAAVKSAKAKRSNQQLADKAMKEIERRVASWAIQTDLRKARVLELAMWTMWASRWAKERSLLAKRARKRVYEHEVAEKAWWQRKHAAIRVLIETGLVDLFAYVPENPHKIKFHLCNHHFDEFREEREWAGYMSAWDFFFSHEKDVRRCRKCQVSEQHHFYSLYFAKVAFSEVEDVFSFHVPYPIGKHMLPPFHDLPRVHHEREGWGGFRFGRALFDDEKIVFREKVVEKEIERLTRLVGGDV